MTVLDIILLIVIIAITFGVYYFFIRQRDESETASRKAKNLSDSKKSAKALGAARRFAALHQYQVIAPAQLAKDGKFADLDFIIVGWFGLLCVKCIGLGGHIYGSTGDDMWLQVDGEKRISFKNPLKEAEADTRLVRDTLLSAGMHGISVETVCVFTNKSANLAIPRSSGHFTLKEFKSLLSKTKYEQDKGIDIAKTADAVKKWLCQK